MQGPPWMNLHVLAYIHKFGLDPGPDADAGEQHLTALWRQLVHRPPLWALGIGMCRGCGSRVDAIRVAGDRGGGSGALPANAAG